MKQLNMSEKEFEISNAIILPANKVDSKLLCDFYNFIYPNRKDFLLNNWKWLYNSQFYEYKIPLITLYENRIIGYAGMIPFYILLNNKKYTASWFIDFAVLPEFRRRGLGIHIARKWMEFSDVNLGLIANEKSMGLLKKCGWIESFNTYLHIFPIIPFNYPGFKSRLPNYLCKILNFISSPLFKYSYSKHSVSLNTNKLYKLDSNSHKIFMSTLNIQNNTDVVYPIRDSKYFLWRLLSSPDINKYRIITIKDVSTIIKLCNNSYSKYIDILLVSNLSKYITIRKIIASVAVWGRKKGYNFIRFYTSKKDLSAYLKKSLKSIVNKPIFLFYSKEKKLFEELKKSDWRWELIDTDFEIF